MKNKKFGIKKKLLATVIPVVVVGITILVIMGYTISKYQLMWDSEGR